MRRKSYSTLILILLYAFTNVNCIIRPDTKLNPSQGQNSHLEVNISVNDFNTLDAEDTNIPLDREDKITFITISAAGDCTLGSDNSFGYSGSFVEEADKNGYEYFFRNVKDIFSKDDLTIVNLETTLTNATKKAEKKFRFKGSPEYTNILKEGHIEAVNIANNHIYDYLQKGYDDTIAALKKSDIGYFGYSNKYITEVKGVKIGCLGYEGWSNSSSLRKTIENDINSLKKDNVKLVIVSFHWGNERDNYPNDTQKKLGRHVIDCGADLVLGHHPHVIQGIEEYKGKNIVYSLGNFSFGGNRNPTDKDTFIFQQTFMFRHSQLIDSRRIELIPCSVSSVKNRNNFQPTPLREEAAISILKRIKKYSLF